VVCFLQAFQPKLCTYFSSTLRALSALPISSSLMLFGEDYKPCSSSLCSFLQPPVTSSLLGPNNLLCALFSNSLNHNFINKYDLEASCVQWILLLSNLLSYHFWITWTVFLDLNFYSLDVRIADLRSTIREPSFLAYDRKY
jgi:hypothetical protein